jgi:hypothetical protein
LGSFRLLGFGYWAEIVGCHTLDSPIDTLRLFGNELLFEQFIARETENHGESEAQVGGASYRKSNSHAEAQGQR